MGEEVKYWAIVPAAGAGRRMRSDCPKQYLELAGKPVLQHTLERLGSCPGIAGVGVGISADDEHWQAMNFHPEWLGCVCEGGAERADTVINILRAMSSMIDQQDWVLVHDAARPCVTHGEIEALMQAVEGSDGGLLGCPVTDTVKQANANNRVLATVPREGLWRAQTPQMFRYAELLAALQSALDAGYSITDEASAMERAGKQPLMVEGRIQNIKITLPGDLDLARMYLTEQGSE